MENDLIESKEIARNMPKYYTLGETELQEFSTRREVEDYLKTTSDVKYVLKGKLMPVRTLQTLSF